MKIAFVNTLYHPYKLGGAEKSVQLLAEALVRQGHDISVVALHPESTTKRHSHNGVKIAHIPLSNLYWPYENKVRRSILSRVGWHLKNIWNSATAAEAGRALDEFKPDVVHVNVSTGFSASIISQILSRKIRLVQTLRDYNYLCERSQMFRKGHTCPKQCLSCALFTSQYKRLSSHLSAVVSNSQYVLDAHTRNGYFAGVPSHVIFNIANLDGSYVGTARNRKNDDPVVFGFLGRIFEEKGLEVVLKAAKRLRHDNWLIKIGGSGLEDYVEDLKLRYADSRIEWLGFVEPQRFYEKVDVMTIPSIYPEPLPRSMIESYAAGRTVIASRSGGNLEVATLGKTFATYDAEDFVELSRLMDDAIADPDKWCDGGFASLESSNLFSEATVTARYLAVYRGCDAIPEPTEIAAVCS